MTDINLLLRRYRKRIFFQLLLISVAFILVIDVVVYFVSGSDALDRTRGDLQGIAVRVAAEVPAEVHERLLTLEQQKSDDYALIESYFQSVMDANPNIDDIYTLRPTADPQLMTFVVSGDVTEDQNGNNFIDDFEMKPFIGETYDVADLPELRAGLERPSADEQVTFDKWGAWISGYAPLRNAEGQTVAVVGVDYAAEYLSQQHSQIRQSLLFINLMLIPVILLLPYLLTGFLTRPLHTLATSMKRVSHGDFSHRLVFKPGTDDAFFAEIFNNMMMMVANRMSDADQGSGAGQDTSPRAKHP